MARAEITDWDILQLKRLKYTYDSDSNRFHAQGIIVEDRSEGALPGATQIYDTLDEVPSCTPLSAVSGVMDTIESLEAEFEREGCYVERVDVRLVATLSPKSFDILPVTPAEHHSVAVWECLIKDTGFNKELVLVPPVVTGRSSPPLVADDDWKDVLRDTHASCSSWFHDAGSIERGVDPMSYFRAHLPIVLQPGVIDRWDSPAGGNVNVAIRSKSVMRTKLSQLLYERGLYDSDGENRVCYLEESASFEEMVASMKDVKLNSYATGSTDLTSDDHRAYWANLAEAFESSEIDPSVLRQDIQALVVQAYKAGKEEVEEKYEHKYAPSYRTGRLFVNQMEKRKGEQSGLTHTGLFEEAIASFLSSDPPDHTFTEKFVREFILSSKNQEWIDALRSTMSASSGRSESLKGVVTKIKRRAEKIKKG